MDTGKPQDNRPLILLVALVVAIALLAVVAVVANGPLTDLFGSNGGANANTRSWRSTLVWLLALPLVLFSLWRMQKVFTEPLTPSDRDDADMVPTRNVIAFGYRAMNMALLLSIILFMVPFFWSESYQWSSQSPIGVLQACRPHPKDEAAGRRNGAADDPLSCWPHGPQWVLNIGGSVVPVHERAGFVPGALVTLQASLPTVKEQLDEAALALERLSGTASAQTAAVAAGSAQPPAQGGEAARPGTLTPEGLAEALQRIAKQLRESKTDRGGKAGNRAASDLERLTADVRQATPTGLGPDHIQDLASRLQKIDAHLAEPMQLVDSTLAQLESFDGPLESAFCREGECVAGIQGGLVLPLYIIVFSLFGGAVSMTRRLPEYQRRATHSYQAEYEKSLSQSQVSGPPLKPPLEPHTVREYVVFQIMQTLSAPLIAATAYSLIDPSSQAAIVTIGFGAGFASEPILIQLRKLAERFGAESYDATVAPPGPGSGRLVQPVALRGSETGKPVVSEFEDDEDENAVPTAVRKPAIEPIPGTAVRGSGVRRGGRAGGEQVEEMP
jgi:hypothetical protein